MIDLQSSLPIAGKRKTRARRLACREEKNPGKNLGLQGREKSGQDAWLAGKRKTRARILACREEKNPGKNLGLQGRENPGKNLGLQGREKPGKPFLGLSICIPSIKNHQK
ncbi:MAG: hypothetical protein IPM23_02025 [Candidatus Melainabacteria bacterium]|nr:hypothetical protein [Candidatus Melainabacteria bacterium]